MQFNSTIFPLVFAAVYAVYLLLGSRRFRVQNAWLLAASYVFYGYWDPRFLALLEIAAAVSQQLCTWADVVIAASTISLLLIKFTAASSSSVGPDPASSRRCRAANRLPECTCR